MTRHRVYVDFQKSDTHNGHLVPVRGTWHDLARAGIELAEGMMLSVYEHDSLGDGRDDLIAEVRAAWEPIGERWTLEILEWHHESEVRLGREESEREAYLLRDHDVDQ